jgi:acyl carrier protein
MFSKEREMNDIERRIADIMLTKLRQRDPSLGYDDLERPVGDLDLDSLDIVELTQLLERELQVKADLRETAGFGLLQDFTAYFVKLAER